ncbi:type II toxin-antitoxin system PemK/MazF family toxin [Deinococcus frigens]|uniref:type II toxin-antitoxin system PemK/MazF family toxin n=1 Tax=Deinococcus frigens TaxID=249403 RepID=UPI000A8ACF14|nr:type II toxin-antitoxin system PemK/MazF family toxin [Deinococcus frigens]
MSEAQAYAPRRGDLVWATFDPRMGREQGGRRPTLIISNTRYTQQTNLMICLPITSKVKGYSTEVALPAGLKTQGVILASHVYTLDWTVRDVRFIEQIPPQILEAASRRLASVVSR